MQQKSSPGGGLRVGEAIRRIRKRLGKNTTEFATMVGSTSGSISRYENGQQIPSMPMVLLLRSLAQTEEEKRPLDEIALGRKPSLNEPVNVPDNPISEIRAVSRMAPAVFAAVLRCSEDELRKLEEGSIKASQVLNERLKKLAVQHGRPDLAVALGGEWAVRHVIHPGETLITTGMIDGRDGGGENERIQPDDRQIWRDLLDEILSSGDEDAIIAVQHNLVVFGKTVRLGRKSQPKKKSG
jgi:DNA-binding transcriptional regulator YiaG